MASYPSRCQIGDLGYDIGIGISWKALNDQFNDYLLDGKGHVFVVYKSGFINATLSLEAFKTKFGFDPFDLDASKLEQYGVITACKMQTGLPQKLHSWTSLPEPVIQPPPNLQQSGGATNVSFLPYFKLFDVLYQGSDKAWKITGQGTGDPWLLQGQSLQLSQSLVAVSDYPSLPSAVRQRIGNSDPDDFMVNSLFLDLASSMANGFVMSGPIPDELKSLYMSQVIFPSWLQQIEAEGHQSVSLGYLVYDRSSKAANSPFALSDLRMFVSPFVGGNGQPLQNPSTVQQEYISFNYLGTTNMKIAPTPKTIPWNWIQPPSNATTGWNPGYDGIVAIRKEHLITWINNNFSIAAGVYLPVVSDPNAWDMDIGFGGAGYGNWTTLPISANHQLLHLTSSGSATMPYRRTPAYPLAVASSTFDIVVSFTPDPTNPSVTVDQKVQANLKRRQPSDGAEYHAVGITYTRSDVYVMDVSPGNQQLTFTLAKSSGPNKTNVTDSGPQTGYGVMAKVEHCGTMMAGAPASPVGGNGPTPLQSVQQGFFPGGATWSFRRPNFADNGDLLAEIKYNRISQGLW